MGFNSGFKGLIHYSKSALRVSGDVFAHHQEHLTVFTLSGSVHPSLLPVGILDELKLNIVQLKLNYVQYQLIQDTTRQQLG